MKLRVLTGCLLLNFVAGYAGNQAEDFLDQELGTQTSLLGDEQALEETGDFDDNLLDQRANDEESSPDLVELESEYDFNMPNTLDTLGFDDSGNWVEKRVYWERAEEAYGKLRDTNVQVSQEQLQYFAMRNEVDKQLSANRYELGLNELELTKVLDYLLGILEQTEQNHDQAAKDDFKVTILDNQDQLLLLQASLAQLTQVDSDLDSVVIKAIDQVQKSNEYERKAWEDFKQIGRVLNDESARKLYYQVISYRKNIKLILNYLKTDLKRTFESLISKMRAQLSQIQKITNELKDAGIDLKYELKSLNQGQIYRKDIGKEVDASSDQVDQKPSKSKDKSGFWFIILDSLNFLWQVILWLPKKLLGLFGLKF